MAISRYVKYWLIVGLFMLFMQIIIGGITRLTGSGLSITKWEIVMGTVPPVGEQAWNDAFDLYKETPQYLKINKGMSLSQFKFIYFWEYIHRLWARFMGFVFLFPFLFFSYKKMLPRWLKQDLGIVVLLAALAASFGWIMVASGLQDRPWVNAYKLSLHLIIGFSVFCYLLWTFFKVLEIKGVKPTKNLVRICVVLNILIVVQILFGGWMSGMKAGLFYPSWPDMNGEIIPQLLFHKENWRVDNLINYDTNNFAAALIQALHRATAYIIAILSGIFVYKIFKRSSTNVYLKKTGVVFIILLITQLILGILTLINCVGTIPVTYGVLHQALGLLLLSSILLIYYQLIKTSK
jgi:cytochrome c oxidase assembly protein subunit 15